MRLRKPLNALLLASGAALLWSAPASAQQHPIIACALEKAPDAYEAEVYRAFSATVLGGKELALDRDEFLGLFANCPNFSKLAREDQMQMAFAFFSVIVEMRTAPRLRQGGIDVEELDKFLLPSFRDFSLMDLLGPSSEKSSEFEEKMTQSLEMFFLDKPEALFLKNQDALVLYSIGLMGRLAITEGG